MEQRITHACGHEQTHYLTGFASQHDRKARWLTTTKCRSCFITEKKTAQADAASRDNAAIAHLDLPSLTGSERQVAWATSVRASRLAALVDEPDAGDTDAFHTCLTITDAKWWIDYRDLANTDLLATAGSCIRPASIAAEMAAPSCLHQAA
ncbi:hypothetical protein [Sphingomonas mollis]|uniref:Uncharacterized protein n=1 Tax=Sphingomonas mollis TaxID=2795726 RepID=A0ABS0XV30_9SPHN|nr:hypothetical protein [Sphingomonas sp. BT553]MBJ6123590.1 hypothetical protein [Sphingomonas sp. BT553]